MGCQPGQVTGSRAAALEAVSVPRSGILKTTTVTTHQDSRCVLRLMVTAEGQEGQLLYPLNRQRAEGLARDFCHTVLPFHHITWRMSGFRRKKVQGAASKSLKLLKKNTVLNLPASRPSQASALLIPLPGREPSPESG